MAEAKCWGSVVLRFCEVSKNVPDNVQNEHRRDSEDSVRLRFEHGAKMDVKAQTSRSCSPFPDMHQNWIGSYCCIKKNSFDFTHLMEI